MGKTAQREREREREGYTQFTLITNECGLLKSVLLCVEAVLLGEEAGRDPVCNLVIQGPPRAEISYFSSSETKDTVRLPWPCV
jgi:hypothetical protein